MEKILTHFRFEGEKLNFNSQRASHLVGPVTPPPILLYNGPDDLYTMQNENPDLQPNRSAQSDTHDLPT